MSFGEKLRQLGKERNWSQDAFGAELDIHGRHIGKYETGKVMPGAETLLKITRVFSVSVDYLLLDEATPEPAAALTDQALLKEALNESILASSRPLVPDAALPPTSV